jgi:sterol desaturase/sphingolipid hydroxylase (fatty acid hydroxylase superfamily)
MHRWFFEPACCACATAVMFTLARRRVGLVWPLFFFLSALLALVERTIAPLISIGGLVAILWVEHLHPRIPAPPDEPIARKLGYIFAKKAVRPFMFGLVAVTGLSLWKPSWGLQARGWPLWAQTLVVMFAVDLAKYWIHRAEHRVSWWWKFHRVHHLSRDLRAISFAPTHLIEWVLVQAVSVVGLSIVLGVQKQAVMIGWALPAVLISAYWAHSNVDLPRDKMPWWGYVVVSPNVHGLHHAEAGHHHNFGENFCLWDRLFGTFLCPVEHRALLTRFGVEGEEPTESFWGDLLLRTGKPSVPASSPGAERDPALEDLAHRAVLGGRGALEEAHRDRRAF